MAHHRHAYLLIRASLAFCAAVWLLPAVLIAATAPGPALPEGDTGIAARYAGDAGIERDPAVIFADGFEAGGAKWKENGQPALPASDALRIHSGKSAVRLFAEAGKAKGCGLYTKLDDGKEGKEGHERVHARWYVFFAEDFDQGNLSHAGGNLAGVRKDVPFGSWAGKKPDGTDFFSTRLEPARDGQRIPPPGELEFYTYSADMKEYPEGGFYGSHWRPGRGIVYPPTPPTSVPAVGSKAQLERGRWHCLEIMVALNQPDKADGEQAFWVDGNLMAHFTGIRWRTVDALRINTFGLTLFIHDNPKPNTLWYDDVVVAKSYIGPMRK